MDLQEAIQEFRTATGEKWTTPTSALNQCAAASYTFRDFLHQKGIEAKIWDIVVDDEHDRHIAPEWYPSELPPFVCNGHCVVLVDGKVIDWTAKQYNPNAPCPLIFTPKGKS